MSKVTPFPTTDDTLRRDLLASLNVRGVAFGETWGDVKKAVEAFGVTDSTPFSSMEIGVSQYGCGRLTCDEDDGDGINVREMSTMEWDRVR